MGSGVAPRPSARLRTTDEMVQSVLATPSQSYLRPTYFERPEEPGVGDWLKQRAVSGLSGLLSSPLMPLNLIGTTSRASASLARELVDLLDSDDDTKASFGDFWKQTMDVGYGYGTAFPMKGWKGRILGFAGDVLLDPLTYATFGGTAVVKGAGMAARSGARAAARAAAKEATLAAASTMGRAAARRASRAVYRETYERALAEFGAMGGRAVLGKQVYGREGREKLARHVDKLMQDSGKDLATRQTVAARVAARGKSALYDSAEGMEILSRLGVAGPGIYYFGSRVKVPGSDLIGKMLERGVTSTRLGISRSAPVARMLRNFVPEGTGRVLNFGPETIGSIRAGLQIGRPIMVDGREIDSVLGLALLRVDDVRRIGVAEATENWDVVASDLVRGLAAWESRHGAQPHLFFDQANYLGRVGFNRPDILAGIERANPGATAELEVLYGRYKEFMDFVKTTLDSEAAGTGRVIGTIEDGYVPRMYTDEFADWVASYKWPDDVDTTPARYMGSLKNRTLEPGMDWYGHTLQPEDLTIARLNELATRPTEEWYKRTARELGRSFDEIAPPPKPFVEDTAGIFLRYVRQQAEQVGTFRMVKAMLEDPEYARSLDAVVPTLDGAEAVAREAAEAAGRYQAALADYHAAVRALRVSLDASFDEVASRSLVPIADEVGVRSSLQLVSAQIESGDLSPEMLDDVVDGIGRVIDDAVSRVEQLDVARVDFEPMLQDDSGLVQGNYGDISRQLDELRAELAAIRELYSQGARVETAETALLPGWQRNRILADVINRLERYTEHAESVIADINRWSLVEDVVPRLDAVGNVDADSLFRILAGMAPESKSDLNLPKSLQGLSPFSQAQYRRRVLRGLPKRRNKKGAFYVPKKFRSLTQPETKRLENYYALFGRSIEDSVRRVSDYKRARQAISAALKIVADGRELSAKQIDRLRDVVYFTVFKHGQSELAGLDDVAAKTQRLLYDEFVWHNFIESGDNQLLAGEDGLIMTHEWLARIGDRPDAATVDDLYKLQDLLHFASSSEQLWEMRTALQGIGIPVGDDVIAQILLHNSDDYVVDALRLNDMARLEQLRPSQGSDALPYGRRAGHVDDFGDTWKVTTPTTLKDLGDDVLARSDEAVKAVEKFVPPTRLAEGVNMIKRHLFARIRTARARLAQALEEISSIDQSIRASGYYSRARVRAEMPDIIEKATESIRRKLRGDVNELAFRRRLGVREYFDPLRQHMSMLGLTLEESGKIVDDWMAQYGGRFEQLIDIFLRSRTQVAEAGTFQYYERDFDVISYFLGGQEPRRLRERWLAGSSVDPSEIEAVIVTVLRGVFEDSARFVDEEYSLLVERAQIAYLEAVQQIESANVGLDVLRGNPYQQLYLSDDLDAIDFSRLQPGIESDDFGNAALEGVAGRPGAESAEIQLEIDALEGADDYLVAKSTENYFSLAQQLARISIPEGENFFGLTADTLDDFLAGVVGRGEGPDFVRIGLSPDFYRLASDPRANPTGDIVAYMRLRVEEYVAAGNLADADTIARRSDLLDTTWKASPSYRYLRRIRELKAEKMDRAIGQLTLLDDVEILLKRLRRIHLIREKEFEQIRYRTLRAYRDIDESSALLGQESELADTLAQRRGDVGDEFNPGIDAEEAADVAQSLEYQLRAQGIFGVEDVSLNQSQALMQVFENSAQQVVYAQSLNAEDLLTRYNYLFVMGDITDTSQASEFLSQAEYVLEMIEKMRLMDSNLPPALKSEGTWAQMQRRLRRKITEIGDLYPDSRSAHKPGTVRLFTGEPELVPASRTSFDFDEVVPFVLDESNRPTKEGYRAAEAFGRRMLEQRATIDEFTLRGFPDPEGDAEGRLARVFMRSLKSGEGKDTVGYELLYYDKSTGRAVFRNIDSVKDEVIPTTERFDPSVTPGGKLERSTQQEADAVTSRSASPDYIGRDDQVALPSEFGLPVRVETGSRLDSVSGRSPGVIPARTFDSLDELKALLGVEDVPTTPSVTPPAVAIPAAAAPSVPAPPTPIPTAVAAYDPVQAVTTPNVLSSAEKAQQGKDKLEWLVSRIPSDASDQWRAAFTNFVDRATVWLEQMSESGELDPGLMALLGSHFEAEMAFMEAAAELGESGFDAAMLRTFDDFTGMTDVVEASVYFKDPRRARARKLVEEAVRDHFPSGWQQLHDEYYPNIIVSEQIRQLWASADFRRDPAWMDNGFIDALKELNKFHKAYAVLTPGFHIRNAIGNAFSLYFAGADMRNVARGVALYVRMQNHLKSGAPIEAFLSTLDASDAAIVRTAREATFGAGGGIFSSTYQEAVDGGRLAFLYKNPITQKNYSIGQYSDDAVRFALGFDIVLRGGDRDAAQIAIKRFFFDYEDLSKADRYIKEIIPFWLWSSRNFVSQIQNIFLNPKRYVIYTNLKKNLRADDEKKTEKNLPFVAELGGFKLPVGRNLYFVPDMGAARAVQLPAEYGSYKLVNSFTPWARIPIETFMNRRSFTDKPVYGSPTDFAGYLATSFLPPLNQVDRMGILPGGKPINWNAISSYLGNPVRKYGD